MTERDRTAERIDPRRIHLELAHHRQRLRRERLVELDPAHVLQRKARPFQCPRNGLDRPDPHHFRRHACHRIADKACYRAQVVALQGHLAHQQHGGSTVRHLRAVACGDRSARGEHRPQPGQLLDRRVRTWALVLSDATFGRAHHAALARNMAVHHIRHDFRVKQPSSTGCARAPMRFRGERVLILAAHLPLCSHPLGGQPHAIGNVDVLRVREDLRVDADLVAHDLRHRAHALGARGNHHVSLSEPDAAGGIGHRLQARGAKAVHRHSGHAVRQAGEQQRDARHVHALLGLRHGTTRNHVADLVLVQIGDRGDDVAQHPGQHVVGANVAKRAIATGHRRAQRGDDVGILNLFAHRYSLRQLRRGLPVSSMCAMRCWVFSLFSNSRNWARSTSSTHCSPTRRPESTSPPHSAVAAALATL